MQVSDDLTSPAVEGMIVHALHSHWALGELGPCLIVVWRGVVTEEALRVINARIWEITQTRPRKCAYINVIERNSPAPSAPLRKLAMEGLSRPGTSLGFKCAVIEGNEFRSAMVRAVMTGMALLRPQDQPTKFFKTTQEMAVWLAGHLREAGADIDGRTITRGCEHLRSQMPV